MSASTVYTQCAGYGWWVWIHDSHQVCLDNPKAAYAGVRSRKLPLQSKPAQRLASSKSARLDPSAKSFTSAGRTRTTVCATHRALVISKDQAARVQSPDQVLLFLALSRRDAAAAMNVVYFASFARFTAPVEARLWTLAVQLLS